MLPSEDSREREMKRCPLSVSQPFSHPTAVLKEGGSWDASWLCEHICGLPPGATSVSAQPLRFSGGLSGGCGQHGGFMIERWKSSLFSTTPLGLH